MTITYLTMAVLSLSLALFGNRCIKISRGDLDLLEKLSKNEKDVKFVYGRESIRKGKIKKIRGSARRTRIIGIFCITASVIVSVVNLVVLLVRVF